MLIDNTNFLRTNYPDIYQQMKWQEEKKCDSFVAVEETKNSEKTLKIINEGKGTYLHSKYNPIREARAFLHKYEEEENIQENTHIIFYGTGLGYHIDLFLQKYDNISFSIYEPIEDILYQYITNRDLNQLPTKNMSHLITGDKKESILGFLREIIKNKEKRVIICSLPSYQKIFSQNYEDFLMLFKSIVQNERGSLHTNYSFQKRWILNSMINFKEVLKTPNILINQNEQFKGKPAILVAAGPSLDEEIESLRYIKENRLAYIFTVGSAINTLIHHEIYPHAACTYDPTEKNQVVFEKVKQEEINEIPLIFGSSVGYETLQNYPANKLHMITSQDSVATYYLKSKTGEPIHGVVDAPSIAVVTLQLLYKLGFEKIILVGQNLAYKGHKDYASGIDYHKGELDQLELKNAITIKDVYGDDILTNVGLNRMRQQMEMYIEQFKAIEVLNTTKGGAHIKGAAFIELEEIIKKYFNNPVVEDDWLYMKGENYHKEYMKKKMQKMNSSLEVVGNLLNEINSILSKIQNLSKNGNFSQVEKMYNKLDKVFHEVRENDYFKVFIKPMNRVYYQLLADEMLDIKKEKNRLQKAQKIINALGKFIFECRKDMEQIEGIFTEVNKAIEEYIEKKDIEDSSSDSETNSLIGNTEDNIYRENTEKKNNDFDIGYKDTTKEKLCIENIFVSRESTLKKTMEIIDQTARGIALVADTEGKLEGTVTDGDVRRAIIKGIPLEAAIENVMNKNFVFVGENYSDKFIENIFNQKSIFQIPVVDEEMKVVDIVFYQDFIKKPSKENWAVIMAGGLGKRLMPLTADTPKPMLAVGPKPILETIIEQLKNYGYKNILLCVNYKSEVIENYFQNGENFGVNIQYIKEEKPLGTAGALKLAKNYLDKPFVVINGDILTKLNFQEFMNYHQKNQNSITIAARRYDAQIPYGVLEIEEEAVVSLKEKPVSSMFINGGIYCLESQALEYIPQNEYFDITQLIDEIINREEKVGSFPITEYWVDIGKVEDYHQANTDYQELFRREASATNE